MHCIYLIPIDTIHQTNRSSSFYFYISGSFVVLVEPTVVWNTVWKNVELNVSKLVIAFHQHRLYLPKENRVQTPLNR